MKYFLSLFLFFICLFLYFFFIVLIFYLKNRKHFEPNTSTFKKPNKIKMLFWDFPKQLGIDISNRDPNFFKPQGIIIFTGEQGSGKTMSMIKCATDLKEQYPKAKVISNTDFKLQDKAMESWKDLTSYNNGSNGVIVIWDEIQNAMNSRSYKNFPMEMVGVVTQNRKNKRIILCTAQSLHMVDKTIRVQMSQERHCMNLFGVLNVVFKYKYQFDSDGEPIKKTFKGLYFYCQNDKLRNSYDTYKVIDVLTKSGFNERSVNNDTKIVFNDKKKKSFKW